MQLDYRLRIRNAANDADALEVTSVRGGTNPYISAAPTGDGATLTWLTGKVESGAMTGRIVDPVTSGTSRLFTSITEDANGRQQLGHRRAFWEFREDGGAWTTLYAGRVTKYGLVSDIEWEITIGDWMKAEHEISVFDAQHREKTTSETELAYFAAIVSDYLTVWPNRGCILGGPMYGQELDGWPAVRDLSGWLFKVAEGGTGFTRLEFKGGYYPNGEAIRNVGGIPFDAINDAARPFFRHMPGRYIIESIIGPVESGYGVFEDVAVLVDGVARRASNGQHLGAVGRFWDFRIDAFLHSGNIRQGKSGAEAGPPTHASIFLLGGLTDLGLTLNQEVRVHVITSKVSESSPVYWTGHPCDFLSKLGTVADIPFDSSALTTVKGTLGADLRMTIRATKPWNLGEVAERCVYGPLGVGARPGTDGEIEVFASRIFVNTPPATTITDADVSKEETHVFDLDTGEAIKRVALTHEKYVPNVVVPNTEHFRPESSQHAVAGLGPFSVTSERFERENADPGSIGEASHEYDVPCMLHFKHGTTGDIRQRVDGLAHEIFDRSGRGVIRLRTLIIRGRTGSNSLLGEEKAFDLSAIPNANKRLGDDSSVSARCLQLVHITPTSRGLEVEAVDSGPNAQPLSTKPTHTIAASTNAPRNVATLSITNAAALNALSYAVRIQMAVVLAGAGNPASTDYTDVAYARQGAVPSTVGMPAVFGGRKVFARARSEKPGSRPSDWSTPVSVTLTALTAPSALNATADAADGSLCDLDWTNGVSTYWTEVWLRLSGQTFAQAVLQDVVPPGSRDYRIYGLTPNTAYIASVRHVDMSTGDRSAEVDDTFTSANVSAALNPPLEPRGFSDERFRVYGLSVVAQNFPSTVEFHEAVEDSIGAGTYGAYAKVRDIPSEFGDDEWTTYARTSPRDHLRRKLKAREVRNGDGTSPSSFTSEVIVSPWQDKQRPPRSSPQGTVNVAADGVVRIALDGPLSIGSYRWSASSSSYPADATVEASGTIANGRSQNDLSVSITLDIGARVYITVVPFSGTGAQGTAGAPIHLTATRAEPQAAPQGTVSIASDGAVRFSVDGPLSALSYKWQASSSSYPADATVQSSGAVLNGRTHNDVSSGITLALGARVYITIVPYTGASGAGSVGQSIHLTATRHDASATKTVYFSAGAVTLADIAAYATLGLYLTAGIVQVAGTYPGIPVSIDSYVDLQVPQGCTLTNVSADITVPGAGTSGMEMFVQEVSATGSVSDLGQDADTGIGDETLSVSLSDSTTTTRYRLKFIFTVADAGDLGDAKLYGYRCTYSMPSTENAL